MVGTLPQAITAEPVTVSPDALVRLCALAVEAGQATLAHYHAGVAVEQKQLLLADPPDNVCKGLSHIILRGCDSDPACVVPEWDVTASPPDWWPCGP